MEQETIKREILKELIFDRLYRCIELDDNGIATFDKYDLDGKDILYMLRNYDSIKYDTVIEILKGGKHE